MEKEAQVAREKQGDKIAGREEEEEAKRITLRGWKSEAPKEAVDTEARANVTVPDSRIIKTARGFVQGYNAQAAVTRDQIIVGVEVTQEENGQHELLTMKAQTKAIPKATAGKENANREVGVYLVNAGYYNEAVLQALR